METERQEYCAVDRIEGAIAVLIDDAGDELAVELSELPKGIKEGVVLRVAHDPDGNPVWASAVIDDAEAQRRKSEADEVLRDLRRRDPGGDIEL